MSGSAETVVQAGVVHGGIHLHQRGHGSPVPVPRQLLPLPAAFANRHRELTALRNVLRHSPRATSTVVLLKGQGGVGKTALALRWLTEVAHQFPDGQLYVDLTSAGDEPVALEDVLGQFLRALGVDAQQVPVGLAERTAWYRSITAERSMAVLLDDTVSSAQVRVLSPPSASSLVVVTSRRSLFGLVAGGAHVIQIDPLDSDGAVELLAAQIGPERAAAERPDVEALAGLCGGLPIALVVAGALSASRPRRPVARTVMALRDERQRLGVLSVDDDLSVRSTLDAAYADLPTAAARMYRILGLHPGPTFGIEVVGAAADIDAAHALRAVDELLNGHLVEELDDDRYRLHTLVRLHARDQATSTESDRDREGTVRRMLEWYLWSAQAANRVVMPARRSLHYAFTNTAAFSAAAEMTAADTALAWLEHERRNLAAAVRESVSREWWELAHDLADALQPLFLLHKHYHDAVELGEIVTSAAVAWGNAAAENNMRKWLARTYVRLGELDQAAQHARIMLASARANADRRAEASALKSHALVLEAQGAVEAAAQALHEAVALLRGLGRIRGEGIALIDLGAVLTAAGRHGEAQTCLEQARAILVGLEPADTYNAARADVGLAQVYLESGRDIEAQELLLPAVEVLAAIGADHEQARAYRLLAELARRTGDTESARRHDAAAAALLATPVDGSEQD